MKNKLIWLALILAAFGSVLSFGDLLFWQIRWNGVYSILSAVMYGGVLYGLAKGIMRLTRDSEGVRVWILMAISLMLNAVVAWVIGHYFNQHMVSDFGRSLECLLANRIGIVHSTKFQYWCNYELLLSTLGVLFSPTLFTGQVLNSICIALVVYPVYKTIEHLTSAFAAVFVSLLMVTCPTLMLYGTITTGEFVGVVSLIYGFYWSWIWIRNSNKYALLIIGGALFGFSQLFKPIVSIVLFAMFLSCAVKCVGESDLRGSWKSLSRFFCILMIYFCSHIIFSFVTDRTMMSLKGQTMEDVRSGRGITAKNFLIGLNLKSNGELTPELAAMDATVAKRHFVQRVKVDYPHYPKLMLIKLMHLYQGDNWAKYWLSQTTSIATKGKCAFAMDVAYMLAQALFILSIATMAKEYWKRKDDILDFMPALLTIVGFSLLIMVIEFQGRYRTSIYPFYYIIIAYAIHWLERRRWL